jgi:hypothetical protein
MRRLLSSVIAAGLLCGHAASAQTCARPADKAAFDVAGLKSELMVTAITCEADQRYNSFVAEHRPDLLAQEKVVNAYFSRNFGKRAQAQHDDYITSLANVQSEDGLKSGTLFCQHNLPMFDEVARLHGGAELSDYAAGKGLVQPIAFTECAAPTRPARALVRTASATVVTKTKTR